MTYAQTLRLLQQLLREVESYVRVEDYFYAKPKLNFPSLLSIILLLKILVFKNKLLGYMIHIHASDLPPLKEQVQWTAHSTPRGGWHYFLAWISLLYMF